MTVEEFQREWRRRWYAGDLHDSAYGASTRIARIRRGKYQRIPPQWRGQVVHSLTKRQRKDRVPREPALDERRGPTPRDWGLDDLGGLV
jgi:hypothetical protein